MRTHPQSLKTRSPGEILKKTFGYNEFRPLQAEIIGHALSHRDALVIMPTGGGKSLCYQIPALIFPHLTIVVSPLISLMKDQVEQLTELGVSAICLNSSLSRKDYGKNIRLIRDGKVDLLYFAPETLLKQDILDLLQTVGVSCLAVDEAHCISEWGHDFRQEYRQISEVRTRFSNAVCMALTATATPRVREDIKNCLDFKSSREFIGSFDRENLFLKVLPKQNPTRQVLSFLKRFPKQSGIIYCFSRRRVDELSIILDAEGFSVRPYHAGLPDEDRKKNQELFIKDDIHIIVATIAFGMGINKPNVRFVIHYDLPKNIEGYYQEIGRSGRDGLQSECMLLFGYGDIQKIKYFINQKQGREKRMANIHLQTLLKFTETDICRRIPLLDYFGETYPNKTCNMCDNCTKEEKDRIDITVYTQKFLSCVRRTNEIFGAGHIIDILRGSEAKKVFKFGHQRLSTYGIGKELSKKQWFQLARQILHQGLTVQDMEYGGLKLTSKAWDVLKGNKQVLGILETEEVQPPKKRRSRKALSDVDKTLFERLRKKRKTLAEEAGVPPYIIFSDRTLMEMAAFFPQKIQSIQEIYGMGEVKLKKYGFLFLDIICEYCDKHRIKEKLKNSGQNKKRLS